MRLLLRTGAHRFDEASGEQEIAAGPDTPGRERWSWELRLTSADPAGPGYAGTRAGIRVTTPDGEPAALVLRGDPELVVGSLQVEPVGAGIEVVRGRGELTILVAVVGPVLVDGIHRLGEFDALVVEGDEAAALRVTAAGAARADRSAGCRPVGPGRAGDGVTAELAVVRLVATTGEQLRWVP